MYKGVRRNADVEDWYDARNRRSWARRVSLSMGGSGVVVSVSPPPPVVGEVVVVVVVGRHKKSRGVSTL
jgi:hypothetical protein